MKLTEQENRNAQRAALAAISVLDAFGIGIKGQPGRSSGDGMVTVTGDPINAECEKVFVEIQAEEDSVKVTEFFRQREGYPEVEVYKRGLWQFHLVDLGNKAAIESQKRREREEARRLAKERAERERKYGPIEDSEVFSELAGCVEAIAHAAIRIVKVRGSLQETLSDFRDYNEDVDFEAYADEHVKVWYDPAHNGVDIGIDLTEDGTARNHVFGAYDGQFTYPETYVPGDWEEQLLRLNAELN